MNAAVWYDFKRRLSVQEVGSFDATLSEFGRIDILINNVGASGAG